MRTRGAISCSNESNGNEYFQIKEQVPNKTYNYYTCNNISNVYQKCTNTSEPLDKTNIKWVKYPSKEPHKIAIIDGDQIYHLFYETHEDLAKKLRWYLAEDDASIVQIFSEDLISDDLEPKAQFGFTKDNNETIIKNRLKAFLNDIGDPTFIYENYNIIIVRESNKSLLKKTKSHCEEKKIADLEKNYRT